MKSRPALFFAQFLIILRGSPLWLLSHSSEAFYAAKDIRSSIRSGRLPAYGWVHRRLGLVSRAERESPQESRQRKTGTDLFAAAKFKNVEDMLSSFQEEPILLAFTAINCGPCKLQKKELAAVSEMVGNSFKMFAIDTEKWPHVGSRFQVGKLPCLVIFKGGQVLVRLEGLTKAEEVVETVRTYL